MQVDGVEQRTASSRRRSQPRARARELCARLGGVSVVVISLSGCGAEGSDTSAQDVLLWSASARLITPCVLVFLWLLIAVPTVFMFADALKRDISQFNGGESSKTLWLVLLVVGFVTLTSWIITPIYYFSVYRKIPRGPDATPPELAQNPPDRPFK